jgi:hypothetical protein
MSNIGVQFPLSAFGDLRTIELSPQVQLSFEYTVDNTEILDNAVTNTGTVTQANAMAVTSTGTTTNSTACCRSKRHAKYRAGLGGLVRFTTVFSTAVADTVQLGGIIDETGSSAAFKNGFAVGYNGSGTDFGFLGFQNDVLTSVLIGAWDDPLDGTGASGVTIDQTKGNVWFIQFQYLGFGAITLWYEDPNTGMPIVVHTIQYANANTTPSVHNPNFHLILWADNKATTSDIVIKSASMSYFIEGKTALTELQQVQNSTGALEKTTVTTEVAIFTIRNKALYASKTNFIDIELLNLVGAIEANTANNLGQVRVVKNATLGGTPSYADISTTDSVVDIDVAGTTVTGGKEVIHIPLAGKNDKEVLDLKNYEIIIAPGETVTVSGISANSATIDAAILWKELF